MEDPVKIVWKFTNKHHKIQYVNCIFLGQLGVKHRKILEKVKNLDFYNTLITVTPSEIAQMERHYGEYHE